MQEQKIWFCNDSPSSYIPSSDLEKCGRPILPHSVHEVKEVRQAEIHTVEYKYNLETLKWKLATVGSHPFLMLGYPNFSLASTVFRCFISSLWYWIMLRTCSVGAVVCSNLRRLSSWICLSIFSVCFKCIFRRTQKHTEIPWNVNIQCTHSG